MGRSSSTKYKERNVNSHNRRLITLFEIKLNLADYSENTIFEYVRDVQRWSYYVMKNQNNKPLDRVTADELRAYFKMLRKEEMTAKSYNKIRHSIDLFFQFLNNIGQTHRNPAERIENRDPKKDKPKTGRGIEIHEFNKIEDTFKEEIKNANTDINRMRKTQDLLFFYILYDTRLGIEDIINLTWRDYSLLDRRIRYKPIRMRTIELLRAIRKERREKGIDDGGYILFTTYKGKPKPLSYEKCRLLIQKIGEIIGERNLTQGDIFAKW